MPLFFIHQTPRQIPSSKITEFNVKITEEEQQGCQASDKQWGNSAQSQNTLSP